MFIVESYTLAVILCVITMFCWGSWGNTQKLASEKWRFELFYWDYVIGMVLSSLLYAFTLGSIGSAGRNFWTDLAQVEQSNLWSAIIGGIVFNAGNILLSASISIAGMAVAFPVGVGIALVLGVIINYMGSQSGNPLLLGLGVLLIVCAIILNSLAYKSTAAKEDNKSSIKKGLILAVFAGLLMAFFYRFIASSMDLENFANPLAGKMTPYTAFFIFSIGVLISNMLFNSILIKKPFVGKPTSYKAYFLGSFANHLPGILGGLIWGTGNVMNLVAAGKAGAAISYGLGQGATLVAAFWGVIIWKEFKNSTKKVTNMLIGMFLLFLIGIVLIIMAGNE
ncbi:MAG TPA: GRP family sugar transporter [Sphingobacterium bovisgrunnientis]|jgi:glucose uptake protein|uniref:GRP family sugar transporter n=1 Tax=Sphingobacterium bovisgrunnientis TaxID=1874697 RepID=UPI00135675BF|nr:GRP family sugar transporter [Sphingobacterium bovisgrunnientis]HLS36705.1 GRP family sugar transporter [Sphingobacterium bovisgrunnientis]